MKFTPTQKAILVLLSDGLPHTRQEIYEQLPSEGMAEMSCVRKHLSIIRTKIRPIGEDIICELVERRICYRHVRLLAGNS